MFAWLRRLLPRPRLSTRRPVSTTRQGAVLHTHQGLAVHFTLFGGGLSVPPAAPNTPRKAAPPRPTPMLDRVFGPRVQPLSDAQARALPLVPSGHPLEAARALTGERYPGRQAILAAREAQAAAVVDKLAATLAPRVQAAKAMQPPGKKPIRVKAHTRADGTKVHAHTRNKPGAAERTK